MALEASSYFVNDGTKISSYTRNGLHLLSQPIEEFIVLRVGPISRDETKTIDLTFLDEPAKIISLYALRGSTSLDDSIDFYLSYQGQVLGRMQLGRSDIPYQFPPLIVTPELQIQIQPANDMLLTIIYMQPVSIIQQVDIDLP